MIHKRYDYFTEATRAKPKTTRHKSGKCHHSIVECSSFSSICLQSTNGSYMRRAHVILVVIAISLIFLPHYVAASAVMNTNVPNIVSDVIAIREGADLDLSCPIVVPNEDMIISWTCDNEPANIKSSRIHVTESGKLRIRSAKVGDSCNYRCEAVDGFGTLSVLIKVIIVDKRLIGKLNRRTNQSSISSLAPSSSSSYSSSFPLSSFNRNQNQLQSHNHPNSQRPLLLREAPFINSEVEKVDSALSHPDQFMDQLRQQQSRQKPQISNHEQQLPNQQLFNLQAQDPDLSVQVEPTSIVVEKNRTFSLECKIKYNSYMTNAPKIIWLKEFIGRKPETINEAHEQNLIIIEDVYYHSLNWPSSFSYSKSLACANSALLIRQANFAHSGKYICFVGYQGSFTSGLNLSSPMTAAAPPKALKYKMALAVVRVQGDIKGELDYKLAWDAAKQPKNLLISIFSTDSWIRNLIIILIVLLCLLFVARFFSKLFILPHKINNTNTTSMSDRNNAEKPAPAASVPASPDSQQTLDSQQIEFPVAIKQLHLLPSSHQQFEPASNSTITVQELSQSMSKLGSNENECLHSTRREDLETSLGRHLEQPETQDELKCEDDHLYSEIDERVPLTVTPTEEIHIYKIPNLPN